MTMEILLGLMLGIGLSAASGLRVFLPPLVLSMAALYFNLPLPSQLGWLGTDLAFLVLLTATLMEVGAYYVPWLDNLLDSIAAPAAVVAGTVMTGAFLGDLNPLLQWSLALVAGGGTAATVQTVTSATRLTSSVATGGMANPVVATLENVSAILLAVLTLAFPLLAVALLLAIGYVSLKWSSTWLRSRRMHRQLPENI